MKFLRENWIALLPLLVAVVFLAVGICRGEAEAGWQKAVRICMECIGLG